MIILSKNEFELLRPNLKDYGKYMPQGLKLAFVGKETTNWTIYADTLVPLEEKVTEKSAQNQWRRLGPAVSLLFFWQCRDR